MNNNDYYAVLQAIISIAVILIGWAFFWKDYALDKFRQNLFNIRGQLFDMALNGIGGLRFDMQVYGQMRTSINKLIKHANKVSFPSILFFQLFSTFPFKGNPYLKKEYQSSMKQLINEVQNEQLRKKLELVRTRIAIIIIGYLFRTSPIFWLTAVALMGWVLIVVLVQKLHFVSSQALVEELVVRQASTVEAIELQANTCPCDGNQDAVCAAA